MEFCNCKFYMLIKLKITPNLTLYFLVYISSQGRCENLWTLPKSISRPRPGYGIRYDQEGADMTSGVARLICRACHSTTVDFKPFRCGHWLCSSEKKSTCDSQVYSTCLQHVAANTGDFQSVSPWLENKS